MEIVIAVLVMLLFLLLKGFFSGSEIALVSSDKIKLRHKAKQGSRGAGLALKLFRTPEILLSTTLVGTNLSTVDVFPTLEHWLQKPMIPINIACIWHALRASGIHDRVTGRGRLLEEF